MMFFAHSSHTEAGIRARQQQQLPVPTVEAQKAEPAPEATPEPEVAPKPTNVIEFISPMRALITRIAEEHGLTYADMIGSRRTRLIVVARREAIWAVKDARPCMSLPQIGRLFHKDHTSIYHALQKRGTR